MTRLLDASAAQSILLTAPAGYGKTSLACEWLADRTDVAWYRATAASADVAAFSVGIADSMQHVVQDAGKRLRQRLLVSEPPEKAARPMAELLAEDLAAWPDGARLVLDDYHLVADSTPVEEFVDWLLTLVPTLRVVVTSRHRPGWASARRMLHGEILEVGHQQLAMSDAEAAKLLDGRPGDSVQRLLTQAQGWPALIGLASLAMEAAIPDEHMTEQLYRYFAEEVYRTQESDLRRFMLLASVPSSLTVALARSVLDEGDASPLLERLLDAGLVHPVGDGELSFHPLLREFLRRKLEDDDPEAFAALADRVIAFARSNGRWEEAFELSLHRRQVETAAAIVAEASTELLPAGQIETLDNWLAACGPAAAQPPALLVKIDVLLRQGRVRDAYALAQDMVRRVDDSAEYASRAWHLAGHCAYLAWELDRAFEFQVRALRTARTTGDNRHALWGAALSTMDLELDDAHGYLEKLDSLSDDDISTRLRVLNGRIWAARQTNALESIYGAIENSLPLVEYSDDPSAQSSLLVSASYVATLKADYIVAKEFWARADAICDRYRLGFARELSRVVSLYADVGCRQLRLAGESLAALKQTASDWSDTYLETNAMTLGARLELARGDINEALEMLDRHPSRQPTGALRAEPLATRAVIEAALGHHIDAEQHAQEAVMLSRSAEIGYLARFARIIVSMQRSNGSESREQLVDLFLDAHAHAVLDPAVVAYRAYSPVLELLGRDRRTCGIVSMLFYRSNDQDLARTVGLTVKVSDVSGPPLNGLTPREHDVVRLMCDGLTNREIAQRLYIAESTTKVHVRHVLRKLGVRSRLQAVLVAQDAIGR